MADPTLSFMLYLEEFTFFELDLLQQNSESIGVYFQIRNFLQEANWQFAPEITVAIVKLVPRTFCNGDIYL